jgi:hypothetical protein
MGLTINILQAIVGVAALAAIAGMALLVLALVLRVWPKMPQGDEILRMLRWPLSLIGLRCRRFRSEGL